MKQTYNARAYTTMPKNENMLNIRNLETLLRRALVQ